MYWIFEWIRHKIIVLKKIKFKWVTRWPEPNQIIHEWAGSQKKLSKLNQTKPIKFDWIGSWIWPKPTGTDPWTSLTFEKVYGNWEESYNILLKYLQALHLFVLGTIVRIQLKPALDESGQPIPNKVIFHRLFWSFKTCIVVFAFCKPMVQIDETWLYGRYWGTLLIAFAHDGANNYFH